MGVGYSRDKNIEDQTQRQQTKDKLTFTSRCWKNLS